MTQLVITESEIAPKGKCYVICPRYDAADFDAAMADACEMAAMRGARTLYFSMRDETHPLLEDAYIMGGREFAFDTEFLILEKTLIEKQTEFAPLRMRPLRAGNDALFCAIYNESFFHIPNSRTMENAEACAILDDPKRSAGFFMEGGEPIGIFVLDAREATPEIAAIAVREEFRGRGYGKRALYTLEARLRDEGHTRAQLLVAESNLAARGLYRAGGYGVNRMLSRWYRSELCV